MAVILVTHDLGVVATRTDEIAVMYAGRIVEKAPTRTLFAAMAMPYTAALLASTPRLSEPSHSRLAAIDGDPPTCSTRPGLCLRTALCLCTGSVRVERPPLVEADEPGHSYACWYPLGGRAHPGVPVSLTSVLQVVRRCDGHGREGRSKRGRCPGALLDVVD